MTFAWDALHIGNFIGDLILILVLLAFVAFIVIKVCRRKFAYYVMAGLYAFIIVSFLLNLQGALIISSLITSIAAIIFLQANIGDLRKFLSNPFKTNNTKIENYGVQKIYDVDYLADQLFDAVSYLSKGLVNEATKEAKHIGAIITFEQSQSMRDIIKNGVQLNIPCSAAILKTIFYPGTLLHDGAVVMHGNTILAASVFYNPSTRSYAKKFGSRHRAAIGISEITDSLTIIVSEETGRVSFASNGEVRSVELSKFKEYFKEAFKVI